MAVRTQSGQFASELRESANRCAHGDTFSPDDADRALDTERWLAAIGAAEQAGKARSLRLTLALP